MFKTYYFERFTQRLLFPYHALVTTSPRKILFFINLLMCVTSFLVAALAIFLCQLLFDPNFTEGWITWLGMAIVSLFIALVAILGMRGAHLISFDLLLAYFWLIILFIVPFIVGVFSCFNYNLYTEIWFKHSWDLSNFKGVRRIFCPTYTAETTCFAAPVVNTSSSSQYAAWCLATYNVTNCEDVRDRAINRAVHWGATIILVQSFVALGELLIIVWSIYICVQLLTPPVITQTMLDVINYLLIFPVAGCVALTIYYWWIQDLDLEANWFPLLYLALAVAQIVALPLGIISGKIKSRALLSAYIGLMILIVLGFAASAGVEWTLAGVVVNNYLPSQKVIYDYACRKGLPGCSGCSKDPQSCPEWTRKEVLTLFSLDLRLAGMVSTGSILFILGGLIVAFLVDNSLKNYKTDYI